MRFYFLLQYRRLLRRISTFGLNPWFGLLLGALAFAGISELVFARIPFANYLYPVSALLFVVPLSDRSRNEFLRTLFRTRSYRQVRLIENAAIALPFALVAVLHRIPLAAVSIITAAVLFSLYDRDSKGGLVLPTPFARRPYEFSNGFRRTWWLLLLAAAGTVLSVTNHNFDLGLFSLLCLFLIFSSYYSFQEPLFYVWVHALTPQAFLKRKIRDAVRNGFWLALPLGVALLCFYPAQAHYTTAVFGLGLLYLVVIVIAVYSNYPSELGLFEQFQVMLALLFPPALIWVIPNFFRKAVHRLNIYLK